MSKEISLKFASDELETLQQAGIIPQGCPTGQVALFAAVCQKHNLDPFTKQVHLVGYGSRYSIITGINGFRSLASRTGLHCGTSDALYDLQPTGAYKTAAQYAKDENPVTCTVAVKKLIHRAIGEFIHTARFDEFAGTGGKWKEMPFQMIAKVAEAFALRKAFPDQLAGLNTEEEAEAFSGETIKATKPTNEVVELPALTPQHPRWADAMKAIRTGAVTREQAEAKYSITDENWSLLNEPYHD